MKIYHFLKKNNTNTVVLIKITNHLESKTLKISMVKYLLWKI